MTDETPQDGKKRRQLTDFNDMHPKLQHVLSEQAKRIGDLAAIVDSVGAAMPKMPTPRPGEMTVAMKTIPPSPAVAATVRSEKTMRQIENLMVRQLEIAQLAQQATLDAQAVAEDALRFTKRMSWTGLGVAVLSLLASIAAVVVAIAALQVHG